MAGVTLNHLHIPGKLTELEAVNTILATIGTVPIESLHSEDGWPADVALAIACLEEAIREVQLEGWQWNTERRLTLQATNQGEVYVPDNMIKLTNITPSYVICRGNRMYDTKRHTYQVNRSITGDVVLMLPFPEIPETFKQYIMLKAGRLFQQRSLGSEVLQQFTREQEAEVRLVCIHENADLERNTMADGVHSTFFGHWNIDRILRR